MIQTVLESGVVTVEKELCITPIVIRAVVVVWNVYKIGVFVHWGNKAGFATSWRLELT